MSYTEADLKPLAETTRRVYDKIAHTYPGCAILSIHQSTGDLAKKPGWHKHHGGSGLLYGVMRELAYLRESSKVSSVCLKIKDSSGIFQYPDFTLEYLFGTAEEEERHPHNLVELTEGVHKGEIWRSESLTDSDAQVRNARMGDNVMEWQRGK